MTVVQQELPHVLPKINIGDPVYRFLRYRLGLDLRGVMILMIVVNVIRVIVVPVAHHASLGSSFFEAMNSTDIQLILISFISQPVALYVYWSLISFVPRTFASMVVTDVIRPKTRKTAAQLLGEMERKMTARWLNWLALGSAVATVIAFQVVGWSTARFRGDFGSYPYNDFQQYVVETAYNLLRFWFLNWAIIRILLYVGVLRDWWKDFDANVQPLHPDKAGGFSLIGDATVYSGLLLGGVGLFLAANIVVEFQRGAWSDLQILLGLVLLTVILVPYAFFTPIWSTHKAMERERLRRLHRLSEQYNTLWNKIASGEAAPDKDQLDQLESLERLRSTVVRTVPVWPFAGEDLGRFGVSLAPIWTISLTFIIQALISGFLGPIFTR